MFASIITIFWNKNIFNHDFFTEQIDVRRYNPREVGRALKYNIQYYKRSGVGTKHTNIVTNDQGVGTTLTKIVTNDQ